MMHKWLYLEKCDIETERMQAVEEGRDISSLQDEFDAVLALDLEDLANQPRAGALVDAVQTMPYRADYSYHEPSDLEGIRSARTGNDEPLGPIPTGAELELKVEGAWLGRAAGCLLGKPVEGWRTDKMYPLLKESGNYPMTDYVRASALSEAWLAEFSEWARFADQMFAMPEDDDMNYTVTGLAIFKKYGPNFTPSDVATFWQSEIPILHTCTAERVAYRNFTLLIAPPESATYRNVFREWIGAQIRADFFGYVAPGQPALAAEYAWRDACISHVRNGIYGEMWVAAMLAAAYVLTDPVEVIKAGLAQIPAKSRLHERVSAVLAWREEGIDYDTAVARVHAEWDEVQWHPWTHTISNAMVVAVGLLWGEGDYGKSICRAVQPGFDTDCNGATVGSIFGMIHGIPSIPDHWLQPLHGLLETGVAGYHRVPFSQLVSETIEQIERVSAR